MSTPQERNAQKKQEILEKIKAQEAQAQTVNTEPVAPVVENPVATPAPVPNPQPTPQAQPVAQPVVEPVTPPPAPEPVSTELENLRKEYEKTLQSYKVLQGKFNKEVVQTQTENKLLSSKLEELEEKFKTFAETPPVINQPVIPLPDEEILSENWDKSEIDDLANIVEKKFGISRLTNEIAEVKAILTNLNQQLNGISTVQAQTKLETVETRLDVALPEWRALDEDKDGFWAWADSTPESEFSNVPLGDVAKSAYQRGDVKTIVKIFKAYIDLTKHDNVVPYVPPVPDLVPQQVSPQPVVNPMMELVTPESYSATPTPSVQPQGKVWKQSEINEFNRNMHRMNPLERNKTLNEIRLATSQGRIQAG